MKAIEYNFAVIMAGGVGSRFWPLSTEENPKQFLDLTGEGETLLQQTVHRLQGIVPEKNIVVLTHQNYKDKVKAQLPEISLENILSEPALRNTAPCLLLAALKLKKRNSDAVMLVLPSDHFIDNKANFQATIQLAFERAAITEEIIALGIPPQSPHTGYGYIKVADPSLSNAPIENFTEKPDQKTAEQFLNEGSYYWNAGIFAWKVETILTQFQRFQPEMFALLAQGEMVFDTDDEAAFLQAHYPKAENISIDYAIMEKAEKRSMIKASFQWNDLGSWGALHKQFTTESKENVAIHARLLADDASGNLVYSTKGKRVVIKGLHDFVVVEEGDTLLIFPKKEDQQIKQLSKKAKDSFS